MREQTILSSISPEDIDLDNFTFDDEPNAVLLSNRLSEIKQRIQNFKDKRFKSEIDADGDSSIVLSSVDMLNLVIKYNEAKFFRDNLLETRNYCDLISFKNLVMFYAAWLVMDVSSNQLWESFMVSSNFDVDTETSTYDEVIAAAGEEFKIKYEGIAKEVTTTIDYLASLGEDDSTPAIIKTAQAIRYFARVNALLPLLPIDYLDKLHSYITDNYGKREPEPVGYVRTMIEIRKKKP